MTEFKGLMIERNHPSLLIINRNVEAYSKLISITGMDFTTDSLREIIKENDIKFIMIGYTSDFIKKPVPDFGIPIILSLGDPARRLADGEIFKKNFGLMNASGVITHSKCSIEPLIDCLGIDRKDIFLQILGVDLDYVKDYGMPKDIDVSHTGKFSNYQYRREIHNLLTMQDKINYQRIRNVHDEVNPTTLYENYIKTLNRSWISVGHCTQEKDICHYKGKFISDVGPKNFEVMGSRSCVITSDAPDMEFHGMKDGENCILFNSMRDAYRKMLYYLDDKVLLQKITDNGYELTRQNHNLKTNVYNLLSEISKRYA